MDRMTQIGKLYEELEQIPEEKRYILGGRGVDIINKIHRLQCELDKLGEEE